MYKTLSGVSALALLYSQANAVECQTSTMTFTAPSGSTSVTVEGYPGLVVNSNTIIRSSSSGSSSSTGSTGTGSSDESELAVIVATFTGRDEISTLVSESTDAGAFFLNFTESQPSVPTDPPFGGSSANSGGDPLFFSSAMTSAASALILGPLAWVASHQALALCETETLDVTITVPSDWAVYTDEDGSVQVGSNPATNYGYDFDINLGDYEEMDFTSEQQELLIADLMSAYGNVDGLSFELVSWVSEDGQLIVTVKVSGYTSEEDATSSFNSLSGSGASLSLSNFGSCAVDMNSDSFGESCPAGYEDRNGFCVDHDGCANDPCGAGSLGCSDVIAPGTGRECECATGWYFNGFTCADINDCIDVNCDNDANGACADIAAPGTGYYCACDSGFDLQSDDSCLDIDGCAASDVSCPSYSSCQDVAGPGTGYTCPCDSGYQDDGSGGCEEIPYDLYDMDGWTFYRVPVSGTMTDNNVKAHCDAAGMVTPCACGGGGSYDDHLCTSTSESGCGMPMWDLSRRICGGSTYPSNCGWFWDDGYYTFTYMGNSWSESCGARSGSWCLSGSSYSNHMAICASQ